MGIRDVPCKPSTPAPTKLSNAIGKEKSYCKVPGLQIIQGPLDPMSPVRSEERMLVPTNSNSDPLVVE